MENNLTLIQFGSPWQGASGFEKLRVDPASGDVVETTRVKCEKVMRKTTKKVDGIVIKPTWISRRGLCLLVHDDDITFHALDNNKIDLLENSLSFNDSTFKMTSKEYVLFRKFSFSTDQETLTFFDFSNRLISPERTIMHHDLQYHFSALSRLIDIMKHDEKRHKFLSDLKKRRFKYREYFEDMKRQFERPKKQVQTQG